MPHFEKMLYDNALLLGVYARSGTALGRRVAEETADFLIARARHRRGRLRRGARRRLRGRGGAVLRLDAGPAGRGARPGRRPLGGCAARGHRERHLRARQLDAPAAAPTPTTPLAGPTYDAGCWPPATGGSGRPATTRWWPPGTGSPSPRSCDAGRLLGREDLVDAALARRHAARRRCTCATTARCCASRATGVAGRHRGVLEDHGCVAARLPRAVRARPATRGGSTGRRSVLDHALDRFRADDGGFFDTAADAEALVARPRDPSDNASPSGTSAMVHALVAAAVDDRRGPLPPGRRGGAEHGRVPGRCRRRGSRAGRWPPPRRWPPARSRSPSSARRVRRATQLERDRPPRAGRHRRGGRRRCADRRHPAARRPRSGRRCPRGVRLPRDGLRAPRHHPRRPAALLGGRGARPSVERRGHQRRRFRDASERRTSTTEGQVEAEVGEEAGGEGVVGEVAGSAGRSRCGRRRRRE